MIFFQNVIPPSAAPGGVISKLPEGNFSQQLLQPPPGYPVLPVADPTAKPPFSYFCESLPTLSQNTLSFTEVQMKSTQENKHYACSYTLCPAPDWFWGQSWSVWLLHLYAKTSCTALPAQWAAKQMRCRWKAVRMTVGQAETPNSCFVSTSLGASHLKFGARGHCPEQVVWRVKEKGTFPDCFWDFGGIFFNFFSPGACVSACMGVSHLIYEG